MSDFAGFIEVKPLSVQMRDNFRDYGMSVISSRALPDVRDGLKPVHRRILYAMHVEGNNSDKAYRKAAKTVGNVIGNYHPHGDSSVYEAMVRLSQTWNTREILVDMHGNNGSMDGDSAAAMRYTEARLSKIAMEMLRDLNKNTVDFKDNYDGSDREPVVLPSRFPQFLVNGTSGIAVGMATSIPSHNLREVSNGIIALIDNPNLTIDDLMKFIQGPDFPTGGLILGRENIEKAYKTGRTGKGGSIKLRAKIDVIEKKGKTFLHITELPYQVIKDKLLEKLEEIQFLHNQTEAEIKKNPNKVIERKGYDFAPKEGIVDKTGSAEIKKDKVSIMIELKPDKNPDVIMNALYSMTDLEKSIPVNLLALVPTPSGGTVPKTLNLKQVLEYYIEHQLEVVERKFQYDLNDALDKSHKLAGLMKALDKLDETIQTIRTSTSREDAMTKLKLLLDVDDIQADDILKRRLQTLATFQQDLLRQDYQVYLDQIEYIKSVLADESLRRNIIKDDLREISDKFGNDRLTYIGDAVDSVDAESLIPNVEVVVTITHNGMIKRTLDSNYRMQRRKGRGVNGMGMYENDFIEHLCTGRNHDKILFFTNKGKVYETKMLRIMEASSVSKGQNIKTMFNFEEDERVQAVLNIQEFSEEQYLLFATKKGIVKKTKLSEYANIRSNGIKAIHLSVDKKTGKIADSLIGVALTSGDSNITLVTQNGHSITFSEEEVSSIGRTGRGVIGIRLSKGDSVISVAIHDGTSDLLVVTDNGFGKRTPFSEFRLQARGGKGVKAINFTGKNGTKVIGCEPVSEIDALILITENEGKLLKLAVKEISQFQRNTQGTKIINLYEGDTLSSIARVADADEEDSEN